MCRFPRRRATLLVGTECSAGCKFGTFCAIRRKLSCPSSSRALKHESGAGEGMVHVYVNACLQGTCAGTRVSNRTRHTFLKFLTKFLGC